MQKGFTVLELLVVIAIIGILSSIVLVSYNGYTAKARLAKTLSWAGSINHSLGDRAVGVWTFDNISTSSNTVYDDSGNNNNGTIYNGAFVVDGVVGKAMSFDGVDDYVDLNGFALSNTAEGTFAAWVYKSGAGTGIIIDNRQFYINTSGSNLSLDIYTTGGWAQGTGGFALSLSLPSSQWYHLLVVKKSGITADIYINGVYRASITTKTGNLSYIGLPHTIGCYFTGGNYFKGLIDDVRIFSAALSQAQIQQHYADGLKTHQNLAQH